MSRADLQRLIERLPENLVPAATQALEAVLLAADPVALAIENADEEDEPLSPEGVRRLEQGWDDVRRGEVISHDQLLQEMEDWDREERPGA